MDRLAKLAAQLLGAPASQVSVLTHVQTVAGGHGLPDGAVGSQGPLVDSLCTVTANADRPLIVTDAPRDVRVSGLPPVTSGAVGAYLGVPLPAQPTAARGAVCVFDPSPRTWTGRDVEVLQEIAVWAASELEVQALTEANRANRVLLDVSLGAARIGTFSLDLSHDRLTMDDRMCELFGVTSTDLTGSLHDALARIHPDDMTMVQRALAAATEAQGSYAVEHRVVLPGPDLRWVAARGQVVRQPAGEHLLIGACYDITETRAAAARVEQVLQSMIVGYLAMDADWRVTYVNDQAVGLLGLGRQELVGSILWDLFPATVGTEFEAAYRKAAETGQVQVFDAYYPEPLKAWYEIRATPELGGVVLYFTDITERVHARQILEQAVERQQLITTIADMLTENPDLIGVQDTEARLAGIAPLLIPALGEWCIVSVIDDHGNTGDRHGLRDVATWHRDPAKRAEVDAYAAVRIDALTPTSLVDRALATGRPVVVDHDAERALSTALAPGAAHDLVARLAPDWMAVLPLRSRGRTLGLLTLFGSHTDTWSATKRALASEIAARAGLALDSARLLHQQRDLARGLQEALLTAPHEPDHVEILVRYLPAAEIAQVGGDWYDAFLQPSGATVLVIGDVVGHDTQAAAAMSQIRTIVRALAAEGDDTPSRILSRTDQVLETLGIGTTATVCVLRLEQTFDELARGITRLRWSNAGHPPPVIVNTDGTATTLATTSSDLLLGVDPGTARRDHSVTLDRGGTILLFTDGLVERRGEGLDQGLDRLEQTLTEVAAGDPDLADLVDRTLARLLPSRPEDDVAFVAARLHHQDRPRPAEARPNRPPNG